MDPDVKEALHSIIEMRSMEQFCWHKFPVLMSLYPLWTSSSTKDTLMPVKTTGNADACHRAQWQFVGHSAKHFCCSNCLQQQTTQKASLKMCCMVQGHSSTVVIVYCSKFCTKLQPWKWNSQVDVWSFCQKFHGTWSVMQNFQTMGSLEQG